MDISPHTPDVLQNLADEIKDGIYAIAGISKNSGKTSFLNQLITCLAGKKLGIMTTGWDGEATDAVYGNPKPAVKLPANTCFTTVSSVLDKHGTALQILAKLPYQAGTRQLWLAKTLRYVEVEIVGAATSTAQIQVARQMQQAGAQIVLIDGSIDRKSIALCPEIMGIFLVAGSSYGNLDKIRAEVQRLYLLSKVLPYPATIGTNFAQEIMYLVQEQWYATDLSSLLEREQDLLRLLAEQKPDALYLPGAVTDGILATIRSGLKAVKTLIIRHPLQLNIAKAALSSLLGDHNVFCLHPLPILCVAINSWSVKGEHLDSAVYRSNLRRLVPDLPVVDIREGWSETYPVS